MPQILEPESQTLDGCSSLQMVSDDFLGAIALIGREVVRSIHKTSFGSIANWPIMPAEATRRGKGIVGLRCPVAEAACRWCAGAKRNTHVIAMHEKGNASMAGLIDARIE